MKNRFLFQLVMLVAVSVISFAVPALAEDATVSSMGILPLLEGMLPESALTWVTFDHLRGHGRGHACAQRRRQRHLQMDLHRSAVDRVECGAGQERLQWLGSGCWPHR